MKFKVKEINFHSSTRKLLLLVEEILDNYTMPVTVRQVFYRLVAQQIIDNTLDSYQKVSRTIRDGRYAGLLDWDKITDETREYYKPHSYSSIEEAIENLKENYRLDRWKENDHFIIVWVEKATMLGQFYPITSKYDVYLTPGRGWGSTSHVWETVRMIADRSGKEVKILHFGDLDPSGWGMIEDIDNRLNEFGLRVKLEHILLNENDISRYSLTPSFKVIVKEGTREERDKLESDPRAKKFKQRFGRLFQVEVEAMDANELIRRLEQALDKYFDPMQYKMILDQERGDVSRIKLI